MAGSVDSMMARQLPAPKTFAPSREDVLTSLAFYFGDPVRRAPCSRALLPRPRGRPRGDSAGRVLS